MLTRFDLLVVEIRAVSAVIRNEIFVAGLLDDEMLAAYCLLIDDDGVVWGATERGFLVGMKFVLLSGEGATLTYQLTHLLPCIRRGIPTVGGF